jgi:hypothetical protein
MIARAAKTLAPRSPRELLEDPVPVPVPPNLFLVTFTVFDFLDLVALALEAVGLGVLLVLLFFVGGLVGNAGAVFTVFGFTTDFLTAFFTFSLCEAPLFALPLFGAPLPPSGFFLIFPLPP